MKLLDFEGIFVVDPPGAVDGRRTGAATPVVSFRRTPDGNPVLSEAAVAWLAALPAAVRPVELSRRFPRIANSISQLWDRAAQCDEYLDSLVVDRRGDRTGFPPSIAQELHTLRSYYAELRTLSH